jgi:hypothetical protein
LVLLPPTVEYAEKRKSSPTPRSRRVDRENLLRDPGTSGSRVSRAWASNSGGDVLLLAPA